MSVLTPTRPVGAPPWPAHAPKWPHTARDIVAVLVSAGSLVAAIWVVHGGTDALATSAGIATGLGQVTALLGTYLALVGVVLMARVPWVDHVVGSDRLAVWHRSVGIGTVVLLTAHVVLTTLGWSMASGATVIAEFVAMNQTWDILAASVGMGLLLLVAATSMRSVRRRISYETWHGLHLYAYLGIALAFLHEVTLGADLVGDPAALGYWVGLYVVAFGLLLAYRIAAPIRLSWRHRLRVAAVVRESSDVASIYLAGRDLDQLEVRAGQFFQLRFLRGGGWWRPHPFSISATPNGAYLRFTVKALGDDSARLLSTRIGTAVFAEGPYGAFTSARIRRRRVVMFAGGVGITPLRAILGELPAGRARVTLIYREGEPGGALFKDELRSLAAATGADIRILEGHRGTPLMPSDPLSPGALRRTIPDLRDADVMVSGSPGFIDHVTASLVRLGVPSVQIHTERFGS